MAAGDPVEFTDQKKIISLDTLIVDPIKVLFNGDFENDMNPQGMILGTLLMGWIAGNSVGTAKTANGLGMTPNKTGRLALGPVYVW